jgi:hypothetical protein
VFAVVCARVFRAYHFHHAIGFIQTEFEFSFICRHQELSIHLHVFKRIKCIACFGVHLYVWTQ